jgi:hypothetical protein
MSVERAGMACRCHMLLPLICRWPVRDLATVLNDGRWPPEMNGFAAHEALTSPNRRRMALSHTVIGYSCMFVTTRAGMALLVVLHRYLCVTWCTPCVCHNMPTVTVVHNDERHP